MNREDHPRDLLSTSFDEDPHRSYRAWRKSGGVSHFPTNNVWVVIAYDSAVSVLRDTGRFSSAPFESFSSQLLHAADPPGHTLARRSLGRFFIPARQAALAESVRRVTEEAARLIRGRDKFRLLADFADPVPLAIASEWLGIDHAAAAGILQLPLALATWEVVEPTLGNDGLIREIARDGELSPDDVAQLASFLLTAAVLTSRDFIWLALHNLARHPELLERAQMKPETAGPLADELLRLEPPMHALLRSARCEVTLEGCTIPEGSVVWISLAAANRDPDRFDRPDEVVLDRSGARHLTFGSGPHFCLGSQLGMIEAEASLRALLPLLSSSALAAGAPPLTFGDGGGLPLMRRVSEWEIAVHSD